MLTFFVGNARCGVEIDVDLVEGQILVVCLRTAQRGQRQHMTLAAQAFQVAPAGAVGLDGCFIDRRTFRRAGVYILLLNVLLRMDLSLTGSFLRDIALHIAADGDTALADRNRARALSDDRLILRGGFIRQAAAQTHQLVWQSCGQPGPVGRGKASRAAARASSRASTASSSARSAG